MIEYLYNAIRAVAGQELTIEAKITDDSGAEINEGCTLVLHFDNDAMYAAEGTYFEDIKSWQFTIPADVTKGLNGRYFYCIQQNGNNLCFKEPLYLL